MTSGPWRWCFRVGAWESSRLFVLSLSPFFFPPVEHSPLSGVWVLGVEPSLGTPESDNSQACPRSQRDWVLRAGRLPSYGDLRRALTTQRHTSVTSCLRRHPVESISSHPGQWHSRPASCSRHTHVRTPTLVPFPLEDREEQMKCLCSGVFGGLDGLGSGFRPLSFLVCRHPSASKSMRLKQATWETAHKHMTQGSGQAYGARHWDCCTHPICCCFKFIFFIACQEK